MSTAPRPRSCSTPTKEFERNEERYAFLRWGQNAFRNFSVVPPGTGICHQVNLEYLGRTVFTGTENGQKTAYPDTLVGTDSHTTMINGLGVLGWGVGGIEAEAAMLGQPLSMLIPEVVGFKLHGKLPAGATATDLVLIVTQMLRKKKVVGKFVEFYGAGLSSLALADRATIANMAPEYGATVGFFPVDAETIRYLSFTGRGGEHAALVEAYCKAQGMFRTDDTPDPVFSDTLELDLAHRGAIARRPEAPAGPRPGEGREEDVREALAEELKRLGSPATAPSAERRAPSAERRPLPRRRRHRRDHELHEHVEPERDARRRAARARRRWRRGSRRQPWVKTSLAPGSKVVTDYYAKAGVTTALDALGLLPRRLRLHDVHRQLGAAPGGDLEGDRRRGSSSSRRCSPGTGTSRGA